MLRIILINGPNLRNLNKRDSKLYGKFSLEFIEDTLRVEFPDYNFFNVQSNVEGEIVETILTAYGKFDGLIINPGGYSHTSIAIRDALEICSIPKIEVHLSNLAERDHFRQNLITAAVCDGYISGFREFSYYAAIRIIEKLLVKKNKYKTIKNKKDYTTIKLV